MEHEFLQEQQDALPQQERLLQTLQQDRLLQYHEEAQVQFTDSQQQLVVHRLVQREGLVLHHQEQVRILLVAARLDQVVVLHLDHLVVAEAPEVAHQDLLAVEEDVNLIYLKIKNYT